jgi:hypothetical protein
LVFKYLISESSSYYIEKHGPLHFWAPMERANHHGWITVALELEHQVIQRRRSRSGLSGGNSGIIIIMDWDPIPPVLM